MSLQIYMDKNLLLHGAESAVQDKPYNSGMCTEAFNLIVDVLLIHKHDERNSCPFRRLFLGQSVFVYSRIYGQISL